MSGHVLTRRRLLQVSTVAALGGVGYATLRGVTWLRDLDAHYKDRLHVYQLELVLHTYLEQHGCFPPAQLLGPDGKPWHSWRVLVLPLIGEQQLYNRYRFGEPWDGPHNRELAGEMPALYAFHRVYRPGLTTTNYLAVVGKDTMWPGAVGRKREEITSRWYDTVAIVENVGLGVHWMEPRDLDFDTMNCEYNHPDGVSSWYKAPNATMAFGTRTLDRWDNPETLRAMCRVNRGEEPPVQPRPNNPMPDGKGG